MTFVNSMRFEEQASRLQKRKSAHIKINDNNPKTNHLNGNDPPPPPSQAENTLAPFPTLPPILNDQKNKHSTSVSANNDDNFISSTNGVELLAISAAILFAICVIGILIRKAMVNRTKRRVGDNSTRGVIDANRNSAYKEKLSRSSQQTYIDTERKNSPSMVDQNFSSRSSHSTQSLTLYVGSPTFPPDTYRHDDDSSYLLQSSPPNSQQEESYLSDPYGRSSQDDYPSPYLSQSPFIPNSQQIEPPYPPNSYGGSSQDVYLSPYSPRPPFNPNSQQRELSYSSNSYGKPDYLLTYPPQSPFNPNFQRELSNSYGEPYEISQHFQEQYPRDSIQGTSLSPRSSPPRSLEVPPHSPLFSKNVPAPTNEQDSFSPMHSDTPPINVSNEIVNDDNKSSDNIKNELKDLDDMIASVIYGNSVSSSPTSSQDFSRVDDNSSYSRILGMTSIDEKDDDQTSDMYSVQPTQEMSNPDHNLPQLMQPATVGFIEPTQSNMVIEHVNEGPQPTSLPPSDTPSKPFAAQGPMYDIDGLKRHAEKILNTKVGNKVDLNKSDSENVKNHETENNDESQEKQRKKSVRFKAELSNRESSKDSNPKKSILINKDDVINAQNAMQQSPTFESEVDCYSEDENASYRDSNYKVYDFDISSYQDNTHQIM